VTSPLKNPIQTTIKTSFAHVYCVHPFLARRKNHRVILSSYFGGAAGGRLLVVSRTVALSNVDGAVYLQGTTESHDIP